VVAKVEGVGGGLHWETDLADNHLSGLLSLCLSVSFPLPYNRCLASLV